jgi:UDP-GlcNAc:undecaprenyl-phosphate GlcNAc-1-phosphate transferase
MFALARFKIDYQHAQRIDNYLNGGVGMQYVLAGLISFVIVYALIPPLRKLAFRIDFVDKPRPDVERKIHREPIPLTAGIAIFIGFTASYLLFIKESGAETAAIVFGGLLVLAIGVVDDWYKTHGKELPALPKLVVQVTAAIIVYQSGTVFYGFNNPLTGEDFILPAWAQFLLTVTWIFGVTTVINFSDGMDGLAGGLSTISAVTLFVVALAKEQPESALMAIILVGVGLGYLRYNKPPAKVFMGDAGASFIGFMLAVIALGGAFKQATLLSIFIPILAMGVPIFDNLFVVAKRLMNGKPIYQADATQAHYRLLKSGLNPTQVVLFLCLTNVCFCLASIIMLLLKV